jgi:hypothetical protein
MRKIVYREKKLGHHLCIVSVQYRPQGIENQMIISPKKILLQSNNSIFSATKCMEIEKHKKGDPS